MFAGPTCLYQQLEAQKGAIFQVMIDDFQRSMAQLTQISLLQTTLESVHSASTCPDCLLSQMNNVDGAIWQNLNNCLQKKPSNVETPMEIWKQTFQELLGQASNFLNPLTPQSPQTMPTQASVKEELKDSLNMKSEITSQEESTSISQFNQKLNIKQDVDEIHNEPIVIPDQVCESEEIFARQQNSRPEARNLLACVPKFDRMRKLGFKPQAKKKQSNAKETRKLRFQALLTTIRKVKAQYSFQNSNIFLRNKRRTRLLEL